MHKDIASNVILKSRLGLTWPMQMQEWSVGWRKEAFWEHGLQNWGYWLLIRALGLQKKKRVWIAKPHSRFLHVIHFLSWVVSTYKGNWLGTWRTNGDCAQTGTWTLDPQIKSLMLDRLSYPGSSGGFRLTVPCQIKPIKHRHSQHLSLKHCVPKTKLSAIFDQN